MDDPQSEAQIERVWDAPTRLMKWTTALAVTVAWIYGQNLSFTNFWIHRWLGYAIGALVLARLLWAVLGAPASRFSAIFSAIAKAPGYALGVLSKKPSNWPGHNPMGSLWLLALWAALLLQVGTGLMAYNDSIFDGGPLASYVGESWSNWANSVHEINAKVLLALVVLHLSAVAFYGIWKGENLVRPMLTGAKWVRRGPDRS